MGKEVCTLHGLPFEAMQHLRGLYRWCPFPFRFPLQIFSLKNVRSVVLIQVVSNAGWFAELIITHHVICSWSTVKKNTSGETELHIATIAMGSTINYRARQLQCSITGLVPLGDSTIKPGGLQPAGAPKTLEWSSTILEPPAHMPFEMNLSLA